jgi:hypothetical protein
VRMIRTVGTLTTRQADRIDIATDPEESREFPKSLIGSVGQGT